MRGIQPHRALEQRIAQEGALRNGERVLIACSGGGDSVGLAAVLRSVARAMNLQLTIGHVNHGVRSSASQDEAVVMGVAAALGLPLLVRYLSPQRSDEATLRAGRYEALVQMARAAGANAVATAHTAQDQTETVLLALFRGTGPTGLTGMPRRRPLTQGVELVRPLLSAGADHVRAYLLQAGLPFAVDPTNDDLGFRRNAVREALAALRPLFPGLDEAVSRAASLLDEEAAKTPRSRHRVHIRELLAQSGALTNVDLLHVSAAVRALERGRSGRFHMAQGVELHIRNGAVSLHRRAQ